MMSLDNFLLQFDAMMMPDKRTDQSHKTEQALTEAWLWLDKENMLDPRMLTETQCFTRRGHELLEHADLNAYKKEVGPIEGNAARFGISQESQANLYAR